MVAVVAAAMAADPFRFHNLFHTAEPDRAPRPRGFDDDALVRGHDVLDRHQPPGGPTRALHANAVHVAKDDAAGFR
jgi:hypothetical protein